MSSTYYDTLEIDSNATYAQIKKAYRRLVLQLHPDKHNGSTKYEQLTKQLNEAYSILSNPENRKVYDQQLYSSQHMQHTQTVYTETAKEEFSFGSFFNNHPWFVVVLIVTLSRMATCNKSYNYSSQADSSFTNNNAPSVGETLFGTQNNPDKSSK